MPVGTKDVGIKILLEMEKNGEGSYPRRRPEGQGDGCHFNRSKSGTLSKASYPMSLL